MNTPLSDRRHPVVPFDPSILAGIVDQDEIEDVTLCEQGRSNTNYRLRLADGQDLILRLHAHGTGARERAAMNMVAHTVPVPNILACGDGWSLMSLVPGQPLAEHPEWTAAAAELLPRIWDHSFPARGWIEPAGDVVPFDFGGTSDFYSAMVQHPDVRRWLGHDALLRLQDILLAEKQSNHEEARSPCLVHGDFNPSNVLVETGRVTAVLDWEFAHAGEPFMDIANLLRGTPERYWDAIRQGLCRGGFDLPNDWPERCETQHLGSYLESLTTDRADTFKQQCADWIAHYVQAHGKR